MGKSTMPSWAGCIAVIVGALLIGFASVIPAHSADFYGPGGGGPGWGAPGWGRVGWGGGCGSCGCGPCGCVRFCGPVVHRPPVIERRFVEREYIERVATIGWPGVGPWGSPDFFGGPPRPPAFVGPVDYYGGGF